MGFHPGGNFDDNKKIRQLLSILFCFSFCINGPVLIDLDYFYVWNFLPLYLQRFLIFSYVHHEYYFIPDNFYNKNNTKNQQE